MFSEAILMLIITAFLLLFFIYPLIVCIYQAFQFPKKQKQETEKNVHELTHLQVLCQQQEALALEAQKKFAANKEKAERIIQEAEEAEKRTIEKKQYYENAILKFDQKIEEESKRYPHLTVIKEDLAAIYREQFEMELGKVSTATAAEQVKTLKEAHRKRARQLGILQYDNQYLKRFFSDCSRVEEAKDEYDILLQKIRALKEEISDLEEKNNLST